MSGKCEERGVLWTSLNMRNNLWKVLLSFSFCFLLNLNVELGIAAENISCPVHLSIHLSTHESVTFDNGSILHDGLLYPPQWYWQDGNKTRGCICEVYPNCLRKCCEKNEVLTDDLVPGCIPLMENQTVPKLKLPKERLSPKLHGVESVNEWFKFVFSSYCPSKRYALNPEEFEEDRFVLQHDGSLSHGETILPHWKYCLDWRETLEEIAVLVCYEPEAEVTTLVTTTVYPFGMLISIPFLTATFLVYAIIPELRNLYGRTLMCYVACLISAYCFLALTTFQHLGYICIFIGFGSPVCHTHKQFKRFLLSQGFVASFGTPLVASHSGQQSNV